MRIGSRIIDDSNPPFVIAEVGANHNGDMRLAEKLIDAAAEAGADCVKFQSWTKHSIFAREVYEKDRFLADGRDANRAESLEATVERYSLSEADHRALAGHCERRGVIFASSAFSPAEADLLADEIGVPFIKVASMDINNLPFLRYLAGKEKPLILSTGLASLQEIAAAADTLREAGCTAFALLHCVAQYPPKDENLSLRNIEMLRDQYPENPIGFSDHSLGIAMPLAAITLGARIIEKHFTLDRNAEGWDHAMSCTPEELAGIVREGRRVVQALGTYQRRLSDSDMEMRTAFRRSIVAARRIPAGKRIEREDLDFKRPGRGFPPTALDALLGRAARRDIEADEVIESDAV